MYRGDPLKDKGGEEGREGEKDGEEQERGCAMYERPAV